MNLLVMGGSNSRHSINQQLAVFASSLFENAIPHIIRVTDFDLPLYSVDLEAEIGIPKAAHDFAHAIDNTDMIVLSLAENNGSYNVGFKNLLDWTSRIKDRKAFGNKKMLLLATSTGARGGSDVLEAGKKRFPFMGAIILDTFSLPSFPQNFIDGKIVDKAHYEKLKEIILGIEKKKIAMLNGLAI